MTAFESSKTTLITLYPHKEYNLSNGIDELETELYGFLSRMEYKQIKKRLRVGKVVGSRKGHWTNGSPSYPYKFNKESKGLDIDPFKYEIYRKMILMFIDGYIETEIANHVNNKGIPSPKNKKLSTNTITRILEDETQLGYIITNKTEGSGHKNKKPLKYFPREEWKVVQGFHTPVKSIEEHQEVLLRLVRNKFCFINKYPLSGLI